MSTTTKWDRSLGTSKKEQGIKTLKDHNKQDHSESMRRLRERGLNERAKRKLIELTEQLAVVEETLKITEKDTDAYKHLLEAKKKIEGAIIFTNATITK